VACPPSNLYRFQKLVRRNKLAFAAASAVPAALVIGLGSSTWMFIRERRAKGEQARLRQQAETETAKSRQVAQFLADMFHGLAPSVAVGRDTALLKAILDKTTERMGTELTNQPEVEIELRGNLGEAYLELGLYKEAEAMARKSLEVARARFAAESAPVAEALSELALALNSLGQLKEAEPAARDSVAIRRKLLAAQQGAGFPSTNSPASRSPELYLTERFNPDSLYQSLSVLGEVLYSKGDYDQAEAAYREALALARKVRVKEHNDVAAQLSGLGLTLWKKDNLSKAEEAFREALAIDRKVYGTNAHPHIAALINNLALVSKSRGKLDDAEALHIEAHEMTKKMVGPEHRDVAIDLFDLASLARAQNRLADAESRLRDASAMLRRLGNDDKLLAQALGFLGEVLRDQRKLDEAYQMVSEGLALRRKLLGNDSGEVAYSLVILASILERQGKLADAEPLARECLAIYEAKTPDHWRVFEARSLLGATLLAQKKYADAEPLLLSGYEGMKQREDKLPTAIRPRLQPAIRRLVRLYEETGSPDRAAEWNQKLAELEKAEVQPKAAAP